MTALDSTGHGSDIDYSPFVVDGRARAIPRVLEGVVLPGTEPVTPTMKMCRLFIDLFMCGEPHSSSAGGTLWVLLTYAHRHNVPYVLTAIPGRGYQIRRLRQSCCSDTCDWTGFSDLMIGSVGPLCPVCNEVTEYDYPKLEE